MSDGPSWAKYMLISGSPDDEYDIITLQYTEEGLLTIDENREGHAAAFGDDIAIECLATEFKREIYVVRKIFSFLCESIILIVGNSTSLDLLPGRYCMFPLQSLIAIFSIESFGCNSTIY